ncbi:hypothetical protein Tco_0472891 [Tanacetum coccineum]
MQECNGGHELYGTDKEGVLRKWYCYDDNDGKGINGAELSFPDFLLVKYIENQEKGLVWDNRFEEWCNNNPNAPTSKFTSIYENLNPRPKDYPFKDWLLTKVGHTNVSEPDLMDVLPLGRENGSRFRDMIRKQVDSGRRIWRKT